MQHAYLLRSRKRCCNATAYTACLDQHCLPDRLGSLSKQAAAADAGAAGSASGGLQGCSRLPCMHSHAWPGRQPCAGPAAARSAHSRTSSRMVHGAALPGGRASQPASQPAPRHGPPHHAWSLGLACFTGSAPSGGLREEVRPRAEVKGRGCWWASASTLPAGSSGPREVHACCALATACTAVVKVWRGMPPQRCASLAEGTEAR